MSSVSFSSSSVGLACSASLFFMACQVYDVEWNHRFLRKEVTVVFFVAFVAVVVTLVRNRRWASTKRADTQVVRASRNS